MVLCSPSEGCLLLLSPLLDHSLPHPQPWDPTSQLPQRSSSGD